MLPAVLVSGIFLLFFGFIALTIWWAARQSERAFRGARALAAELGLVAQDARPRLRVFWPYARARGSLQGRPAELWAYATGSGKTHTQWVALAVQPTARGTLTFRFTRQGLGTKLSQLFGAKEITVGEAEFDRLWFVETNQPAYLQAALLPEICSRLMAAVRGGTDLVRRASFRLEDTRVVYAEVGTFADDALRERLRRVAETLGDLAAIAEVSAQAPQ